MLKPDFYLNAPEDSATLLTALTNMTNLRAFLSNVILPKVKEGHYQINMESFSENEGNYEYVCGCNLTPKSVQSNSASIREICGSSACMVGFGSLDVKNFPSADLITKKRDGKYYFDYLDFNRKYFSMIDVFRCESYHLEDEYGEYYGEVIETLWDYTFGQNNENDLEAGIKRLDYAIEVIQKEVNAI